LLALSNGTNIGPIDSSNVEPWVAVVASIGIAICTIDKPMIRITIEFLKAEDRVFKFHIDNITTAVDMRHLSDGVLSEVGPHYCLLGISFYEYLPDAHKASLVIVIHSDSIATIYSQVRHKVISG
jgi:hypothetical protein